MAIGTGKQDWYAQRLTGGLETRRPPTALDSGETPDCVNVTLNNDAVSRRGGFTPFVKQQPTLCAIRNRGMHPEGNDGTDDGDSLHVPGALLAGDRAVFSGLGSAFSELTLDFFCEIDDLATETIGPISVGGTALPGSPSPIPVKVRPIVSKGPVKQSLSNDYDQDRDSYGVPSEGRGAAHWNRTNSYGRAGRQFEMTAIASAGVTTITTRQPHGLATNDRVRLIGTGSTTLGTSDGVDGVHVVTVTGPNTFTITALGLAPEPGTVLTQPEDITVGMPFCVYLFHDGAAWSLRLSFHSFDGTGPTFSLHTVVSSITPTIGALYHVVASISWTSHAVLRVGVFDAAQRGFIYSSDSIALAATDAAPSNTPCPLQVFDCPQEFVEAPTTSPITAWDATNFQSRPPGLGLNVGQGSYFFAAQRFEGAIDDLVIWKGALADDSDTSYDRDTKLDLDAQAEGDVLCYWSMLGEGDEVIREDVGRGNPLYFTPRFPIVDRESGGLESGDAGSWWFNGRTSYAFADVRTNPNWRYLFNDRDPKQVALVQNIIDNGTAFGLHVEFWVDSVGEPFEQVLVEAHSHMRCVILPSGRLGLYYRNAVDNVGAVREVKYVGPLQGDTVLEPGKRYSVLFWFEGGELTLLINNVAEAKVTIGNPVVDSWPASALTIGMGARRFTNWTGDTTSPVRADASTANPVQFNSDSRSGFVGRIERVSVVVGDGATRLLPVTDEEPSDWLFDSPALWAAPTTGTADQIDPVNLGDRFRSLKSASGVRLGQHEQAGIRLLYFHEVPNLIGAPGLDPIIQEGFEGGARSLRSVEVQVYYKLAEWRLAGDENPDDVVGGRYSSLVEWRSQYAANLTEADPYRFVAEKGPAVAVRGFLGSLWMRCIESDALFEGESVFQRNGPHPRHGSSKVLKPYAVTSPGELGPRWDLGLVMPLVGDTRPSLLVDWDHQRSNERFAILGAGRSLHWMKGVWRADSPFVEAAQFRTIADDSSVWLFGRRGEHILCASGGGGGQVISQGAPYSIVTADVWCKPQRLDGARVLATHYIPGSKRINWLLGTFNGSLFVLGTLDGGTKTWLYFEGDNSSVSSALQTTTLRGNGTIRVNAWNHVYVLLGGHSNVGPANAGAIAWVNGERRDLTLYDSTATGPLQAYAMDAGVPDAGAGIQMFLGGVPKGFDQLALPMAGGDFRITLQPWHGMLTEYRQTDAEDARFSAVPGSPGVIPKRRYADVTLTGTSTYYLLHLNAGEGWVFPNAVAGREAQGGVSAIDELVPIATDLSQSRFARYSAQVFRDRLYVTNGIGRPIEVEFARFSARTPFVVREMGMRRPITSDLRGLSASVFYGADRISQDAIDETARINYLNNGDYTLWVAFVDDAGRQSEPTLLRSFTVRVATLSISAWTGAAPWRLTTAVPHAAEVGRGCTIKVAGSGEAQIDGPDVILTGIAISPTQIELLLPTGVTLTGPSGGTVQVFPDGVRLSAVPRSPQSHVAQRVFFLSAFGGGTPLQHATIVRDNRSDSAELLGPGTGFAIEVGRKLPPPRARLIAAGAGVLFLGHVTEVAAGGGTFSWSASDEVTYFPDGNIAVIDSEDGKVITGLAAHLGAFYVSKRDSVWRADATGQSAAVRPVNQSVGVGGAVTNYDNQMLGTGERGVYGFDGSNVIYTSAALEALWETLPLTDNDILSHFGLFNRDEAQWWLSVRRGVRAANDLVFVLHTQVAQGRSWTQLEVPPHTFMEVVVDPITQKPRILIATTSGQVLRYNRDVFLDGTDDVPPVGTMTEQKLTGAAVVTSARVVTPVLGAGEFLDFVAQGLRGMRVVIYDLAGLPYVRTIQKNSIVAFTVDEDLPASLIGQPCAFYIGDYDSFYTTPWIGSSNPKRWIHAVEIDLEFAPSEGTLFVANGAALEKKDATSTVVKPTRRWADSSIVPETHQVPMSKGYMNEPLRADRANRGKYFRILFGSQLTTPGSFRRGWTVNAVGFAMGDEGSRGGRPR